VFYGATWRRTVGDSLCAEERSCTWMFLALSRMFFDFGLFWRERVFEEEIWHGKKEEDQSYLDRNWCPLFVAKAFYGKIVREVGKFDL